MKNIYCKLLLIEVFWCLGGVSFGKEISLQEVLKSALNNNFSISLERKSLKNLESHKSKPLLNYLPTTDLNVTRGVSNFQNEELTSYGTVVELAVEENIDFLGSHIREYQRNLLTIDSSNNKLEFSKSKILLEVIQTYLDMKLNQRKVSSFAFDRSRTELLYNSTVEKVKVGRLSEIDKLEIELEISQTENRSFEAKKFYSEKYRSLNRLVFNSDNKSEVYKDIEIEKGPYYLKNAPNILENLSVVQIEDYLNKRKDIESSEMELKLKDSLNHENTYKFLPKLSLNARVSKNLKPDVLDEVRDESDLQTEIFLKLNWNLFNGGKDYYERREAATNQILDASSLANSLVLEKDKILKLKDSLALQKNIIGSKKRELKFANLKFKLAESKYRLGGISTEDLLKSKRDLLNAELTSLEAKYQLYSQYTELLHSLGLLVDVI